MLLESLEGKPGHVQILSNTGTRENPGCVSIWSDSMNALQNSKKEWVSDKLRHIKTAYHFFKQYVKWGDLRLGHVAGPENCADIFTKGYGEGNSGQSNQKAGEYLKHALTCLGHKGCEASCPCQSIRKSMLGSSQEADQKKSVKSNKTFREAAAAASIRTTWLVGLPDLDDQW